MKDDNPFDKKLDAAKRMPESFRAALVDVNDTLDFAWASAQSVFEKKATPEHAIMLLPIILARADAERQQGKGAPED